MPKIIVTRAENVVTDSEGQWVVDETGNVVLKDPEATGTLVKTHALQAQVFNPETQALVCGCTFRAEVYWDHIRNPAPAMVDPAELAWIQFAAGEEDEVYEDDEEEVEEEEPAHEGQFV